MLDDSVKKRIMQFASENDTDYVVYITDDFKLIKYFTTGKNVIELKPQPPLEDLQDIVRGNGVFVIEPDTIHVFDESLIMLQHCPRCSYTWKSRKRRPVQCPRCQKRLDLHY